LAGSQWNSRTTWTNTGPAFVLDTINITALGTGIGAGTQGYLQGTGAAPAWELSAQARLTKFGEAQMQITVGANPAQNLALFGDLPSAQTWYAQGKGITQQTPIHATFSGGAGLTVNTGDSIEFRLFETIQRQGDGRPDLVYAPMTIDILGAVPEPGTSGLMVLGLAGLGWAAARRRKT
jgi:hypothetical protein